MKNRSARFFWFFGTESYQAEDYADVLVVQTAINVSKSFPNNKVYIVREDIDLLVLAVALAPTDI